MVELIIHCLNVNKAKPGFCHISFKVSVFLRRFTDQILNYALVRVRILNDEIRLNFIQPHLVPIAEIVNGDYNNC